MDRIVALIPARAGSVRIKNKNIQQFKGIPLLALAVRQALMCASIQEVYVSTDSEVYAEIAKNYGASVPFLRPAEISGKFSTDYEVFNHFLMWYRNTKGDFPDLIVQVRPTAPVRTAETIERSIDFMLKNTEFDSLRSISIPHQTPYKMWNMDDKYKLTPVIKMQSEDFDRPTQSLPMAYAQDGIVDVVRAETILTMNSMAGRQIAGLLEHPPTWDIDRLNDLNIVTNLLQNTNQLSLLPLESALGGNLGIIQGRLTVANELQSFPSDCWEEEFELARKAGYSAIELFRDQFFNPANPLWNTTCDIEQIKQVAITSGVGVRSVCDDYVQQCSWDELTADQYRLLLDLIAVSARIGVSFVVYPLLLKADVKTDNQMIAFLKHLTSLAKIAHQFGIKIALEITWNANALRELFSKITSPNVGLCVDTGNLHAEGISTIEILKDEQLRPYLYHIHLKDRDSNGINVVPGKGGVDFISIFAALFEIGYNGSLVAETDRGDNPIKTAQANKQYFAQALSQGYKLQKQQ